MSEVQTVAATWARTHFGRLMREVVRTRVPFIVERDSIPTVVILSVPEYEQMQRQAAWYRFYELSRQAGLEAEEEGLTEGGVQAEIEVIKRQVYSERYGRG